MIAFLALHKMDLFPAHAGVIRSPRWAMERTDTVPRTRGGDPIIYITQTAMDDCSPHTRG